MEPLSRTEEMVLLAVYRLGAGAYGVTVRAFLAQTLGRDLSVGAVYVPLERLAQRGLLEVTIGAPTPERGGRGKRMYVLTPAGVTALNAVRELNAALWSGIGDLGPSPHG